MSTIRPRAMALRAAFTVLATIFFFLAFRHLGFADVFLFIGLMPLFAALLAGSMLGEQVTPVAWGALGAGFVGVLCLFPTGFAQLGFGHMVAFLAAFFGTVSIILSRYISRFESNGLAQVLYPNLALLTVMALALPFVWRTMPLIDLSLAMGYGAVLFAARWLLVVALRGLPAHAVTSLLKLQFVWMVLIGAWVFGEWPTAQTYLGAGIIVLSGLFLAYEVPIARLIARHVVRA
ncbi:DMT family transporter [Alisedimentitalea sp. MJ-SS2]|uniref:DMT family transporter n=1 Tax=Aliisedimentitalea sp. MJ-SS2 TaxID=3049795 RepID=UPI002912F957|nr:DMT family transporter [Alisedimentitalea sp. MJ-SS2]MDU8929791.1 DMT family transporter [Alisedimentitalea sp. MJ-SS2]